MLAEDRHVGSVERLFHMKKAPMVGTLPPYLLSLLADASRPRVFRRGQVLMREGERPGAAYFLIEGRLHLERGGRVVGHGEPGTSLGGIGIIARAPAPVTATADQDALTLELGADDVLDLLEDHFGILRHFLREMNGRIIDGWLRLPPGTPPLVGKPLAPRPGMPTRDLDLVERIFYLRQVLPFERASINALAELARALSEVHFAPGDRLWSEDEPARHVVLVVDGRVACSSRGGFQMESGPGASLGTLESVAGRPRWYDAVVLTPLTGLSSEIEVLFDVFEDNLEMALGFLTAMSQWLLAITTRLAEAGPDDFSGVAGLDVSRIGPPEEAVAAHQGD
jgi:CRP-like cAMP-binding protein